MINRVVFWQNIISPHYAPMFKSLAEIEGIEVLLVAEAETTKERAEMGWTRPDTGHTTIVINPIPKYVNEILLKSPQTSAHIFSGTRAYPKVWEAFKIARNYNLTIGFLGETGDWIGLKGKLRVLRGMYDAWLLKDNIKYILANGQRAVDWYAKCGYPSDKIFDWAYFVASPQELDKKNGFSRPHVFNILYIGRLSKEKGIDLLIKSLSMIDKEFHLTIVGDGPEKESIINQIGNNHLNDKIEVRNFLPHAAIFPLMAMADLLVLPSTGKDGWGAVVNEALLVGTPVIVSSNCGASDLIKSDRGHIFDPGKQNSLTELLNKAITRGKPTQLLRDNIKKWSQKIEGKAGANYVLDVLNYSTGNSSNLPKAPWKEN